MKRKLKGLLLAISMMLAMSALTACSNEMTLEDSYEKMTAEQVDNFKRSAEQLIGQVTAFSDEEIESYKIQAQSSNDTFTTSALESWEGTREGLGAFKSIKKQAVVEGEGIVTITTIAEFEKAEATVELVVDSVMGVPSSLGFAVNETLAMTMEKAGLNTVMGIGIVFCMLVFLSFVISLFRFIPKLEEKWTGKGKEKAAVLPAETEAAPVEEELADDGELIAVIAAAIAASENTSTEGFVVRSIKKSKNKSWKRA